MRLFGKPKVNPNQTQETIARLRQTIEMLEKRQKFLQEKADRKEEEAKLMVSKKKKREALLCLKQRNTYQTEVNKLQGTFDTLSTQIFALENAKMNEEILNSMRSGAQHLKSLQNNLTVDKVDDILEEIQTQMEVHQEISNAISQPLGNQLEDEDELLRELAELEQEDLDAQLLKVNSPPTKEPQIKFPEVASKTKVEVSSKEEDEYRALEESLAILESTNKTCFIGHD
ncbi:SNF7 family protein [Heterostelium album PN500]|uniref:SNF7 family protein n=1 Tax=Heterostelium pallidum (strain ATCC 26659 / Pp 5 / PN500) TaxID=670386 RepID=D3B9L7_HETP5|nr:SNF7 family protein [Heterostelium album PN500]EFA81929.1 SNF7 family protein [Heterostelium album PN500]|eukprot:XP_020434046.1 SNF7 family protein [Heterostelium album PN500]